LTGGGGRCCSWFDRSGESRGSSSDRSRLWFGRLSGNGICGGFVRKRDAGVGRKLERAIGLFDESGVGISGTTPPVRLGVGILVTHFGSETVRSSGHGSHHRIPVGVLDHPSVVDLGRSRASDRTLVVGFVRAMGRSTTSTDRRSSSRASRIFVFVVVVFEGHLLATR
jgi:hypothetical protein